VLDYRPARIVVEVSSAEVERARLHPAAKEPWTIAWLERTVTARDVVYDIGANIGAYSLVAARLGAARVVAFEPGYATYATLCENVLLNQLGDVVVPLPMVLSRTTGLATLGLSDVRAGAASHSVGDGVQPNGVEPKARLPVLAYRLDEAVAALGLPAPTLVKLDVDGAEAAVLAGGARTFERPEVRSVLIEVDRSLEREVLELTAGLGLVLRQRIDERDDVPLRHIWYGIFER
jgi:FkbM family methyltransferase